MALVLNLMLVQGLLGAFDTLYFHEWKCRLPGHARGVSAELRLHAARDFIYALLFVSLPRVRWQGWLALVLGALLACEIAITLADFVVEDRVRAPLGGVLAGERVSHAIMAIIYGAMLVSLFPIVRGWFDQPSGWVAFDSQNFLRACLLTLMGVGVFASGVRDLGASFGWRAFAWPWDENR